MTQTFVSHHVLEYPGGYTRSVGPVVGRFLTGLRDGTLLGVRLADGRVLVPPTEYDPATSEPVGDDWVELGPAGRVESWTWVAQPRDGKHHLGRPFAFALVRPDGADTAMLHVVDAGSEDAMSIGMRVAPRWRAERIGHVADIEAWVPLTDGEEPKPAPPRTNIPADEEEGDVTGLISPMRLEYHLTAGQATSRYLRGLGEGKIIGGRAENSDEVYAASRGTDPKTGEPTSVEVEVQDTGVITTFCIVNIPGLSPLAPEIPYASAQILLDGANNSFFGLIRGVEVDDIRMGMRVRAVWADELVADHTAIKWWEPTGEPDAPFEHYKDYL
ncbi:MAG TPA: OB-fold domain-containing protein [Acidimicrobiia bacterium]|nr:OB-fold domain-containing protein [Acidimicrobiia bacterium]